MNQKSKKRHRHRQRRRRVPNAAPPIAEPAPVISFIIPALNEERFIAGVVGQFARLKSGTPYEVIVSDNGSSDKTVEIAEQLGARTYVNQAAHRTIASSRNLGAEFARGEILVFCDADTLFEDVEAFTNRILELFRDESLVGAVPRLKVFPNERIWSDRLYWAFLNGCIRGSFLIRRPFSGGQCQIVRKTSFNAIHGYNQDQVHAEDSALVQKLARIGRVKFLSDMTVLESPRRYRNVGHLRSIATGLYSMLGQKILKRNVLTSWERYN